MLPPSCLSALRARPNERQIHPKCVAMRTTRIEALSELPAGAGCQEKQNLPAKGKVFLLDIPFYRTRQVHGGTESDHSQTDVYFDDSSVSAGNSSWSPTSPSH